MTSGGINWSCVVDTDITGQKSLTFVFCCFESRKGVSEGFNAIIGQFYLKNLQNLPYINGVIVSYLLDKHSIYCVGKAWRSQNLRNYVQCSFWLPWYVQYLVYDTFKVVLFVYFILMVILFSLMHVRMLILWSTPWDIGIVAKVTDHAHPLIRTLVTDWILLWWWQ